jgi:hypothetical protein
MFPSFMSVFKVLIFINLKLGNVKLETERSTHA